MESQKAVINDFDDLANWLVTIGSDFSPSELHGSLIGAMSGGARQDSGSWQAFIMDVVGRDQALDAIGGDAKPGQAELAKFAEEQLQTLASDDMSFNPFLPEDEVELSARTEALGCWCRGFLGGFAQAQVQRQREGYPIPQSFPEAVQEALKDLTEIAKATYGGQDDGQTEFEDDFDHADDPLAIDMENTPDGEDLAEDDFVQVSEYVRLAALTVFTEFGWVEVLGSASPGKKPSLH